MQNTFFIWIPSIQKHILFKELSNTQYKIILKNINDESNLNFIANINRIIKENVISDFPSESFTILDRFIILSYFKIQFAGGKLQLRQECRKCEKSSSLFMDLETMLRFLGDKIDKSFRKIIDLDDYPASLICDLPSIGREFDSLLYNVNNQGRINQIDMNIDNHFSEYIDSLMVEDRIYPLTTISIEEKTKIIETLPFNLKDQLHNQFIDPLFETFDKVVFFNFTCECGEIFELKMTGKNIIDLIKVLYRDNNLESWLRSYVRIAKNLNVEGQFLNDLTSIELEIMDNFIAESQEETAPTSSENPSDLFLNYHNEVGNMEARPSEFS